MSSAKPTPAAAVGQTLPNNHRNATNVLLGSLAEVETMLAPLIESQSSLTETLAKLDIEKRCQLELLLAYAINTFAFINLKTNGTAPNNHPVMQELKRIKTYTDKLRHATHGNKPTMNVDKDAATRFIKGALAANDAADRRAAEAEASEEGQGTHTRFDQDKVQEQHKEEEDEDEDEEKKGTSSKFNGKGSSSTRKRMDPFQGYGDGKKKSKAA
ncbi:hypothetical protein EDD11_008139 [Mortierella claussenii]|nr:hypothetical protein EDD11_008139 [Mortierella claussenii]